jgi:hypothetical protein
MELQSVIGSDAHVRSIPLNLSNVQEVSTQDASQYSLMNVCRRFYFVKFFLLLFVLCVLEFHELRLRRKPVKRLDLVLEFMEDFDCMLHCIVSNFHLSADFFLFVVFGIEETEENIN